MTTTHGRLASGNEQQQATDPPDRGESNRADATYRVSVSRRPGHDAPRVKRARLFETVPGKVPEVIGVADVTSGPAGPDGPVRVVDRHGRLFETSGGWDAIAGEWVATAHQYGARPRSAPPSWSATRSERGRA